MSIYYIGGGVWMEKIGGMHNTFGQSTPQPIHPQIQSI